MKIDFTGIIAAGESVKLEPGRYSIVTSDEWSVKPSSNNKTNLVLRIPFTVTNDGQFKGARSAYYHTMMTDDKDLEKLIQNKSFTKRLFLSLGIISDDDRLPDGTGPVFEFEVGADNDFGGKAINAVSVNGERRSLGGIQAIATVVQDTKSTTGVRVDKLEANGKPSTLQGAQSDTVGGTKPKDFPF